MSTHAAYELVRHLSPSFLTPDDAARYAMAQIDQRQGRAMGGYILIDPGGHFRATMPLEGVLEDFLFEGPFVMETDGDRLMPVGYRYHAYYFCDIDRQAQIQRLRPSWSAQRIALTQSFPASRATAALNLQVSTFYAVGPQGSLVRFWADTGVSMRGGPAPAPQDYALPAEHEPVERYIHDLMEKGELAVVISSPAWAGWRGPLSRRWKAYAPDPQPANVDPYISQVYGAAQAAMDFAGQRLLLKPKVRQMGFLLKHQHLARFVVTEPVVVDEPVFAPGLVFRAGSDGAFFMPPGYQFAGMYWLAIDTPAPAQVTQPWLYERFIAPMVLAHGINLHRALKVTDLALYVSTVDGAQLRYGFSGSVAESRFYNPPKDSQSGIDNGQQAALDEGRLPVRTYIQQVAAAGDLSVVKTSALWDVPGRVDTTWQPYSRHPQASLSPVFVLADDAARYAHGQIGSRREHEYIGLILKNAQQRFVATEPQINPGARFDMRQVGPVDRAGLPVVMPAGFSLYGVYSSRARVAMAQGDEAQVAAQMFTDVDIHQVLSLAPKLAVAYLSGSADSLLAFEPYAADLSRELYDLSAPQRGGSQLQRQLQDQTLVPSDIVRAMVLAGVLRVVLGNRVWGPPAKVQSDWSPPYDQDADHVPAQPQLGPVFATAREAVVDACQRWRRSYCLAPQGLGLVLKSRVGDEFVATQTVAGALLDRLQFASEFGAPVLTEHFSVHAVYYSAHGLPKGLRGQAAWVGRHFIGAQDLYAALYNQQAARRASFAQALEVYLSLLDGALLVLKAGFDPFALFLDERGALDPQALPAKLGQTLTGQAYVRQVAQAGELRVLAASTCWDVPGRVGKDWIAAAQVNRHALGPCFISADDAARHAQLRLGNRRDQVYGGLILRRTDGLYVATEPVAVYVENFAPGWIRRDELVVQSQFLGGSTAVARYHTRLAGELPFALSEGERALYQNMFSTDFLGAMLDESPTALRFTTGLEYLFCADGALLSVATGGGALEHALAAKLAVRGTTHPKHNALEQALRTGTLAPREYVNRVARALVLRVIKGSAQWGRPTRVTQWQAPTPLTPLTVDGALSPVFVQLTDALQYVHRQSGARRQLTYGAVFKVRNLELYLASVPQPAGSADLNLERLLVDGMPPVGVELLGLYLCPPAQPEQWVDDPVYRYFVAPSDLTRATGFKGGKRNGYLPVFVGCTDGAWLRLAPHAGAAWPAFESVPVQALAYVHHVATTLDMTVVHSSDVWGAKGRVGADWQPRHAAPRLDPALALGPLFSHPDDAARHALRRLGRGRDAPFLGLVLVNATSTSFVALEPVRDTGIESPLPERLFQLEGSLLNPSPPAPAYPSGFKLVAVHLLFQRMAVDSDASAADQRLGEHFVAQATLGFYRDLLRVSGVRGAFCYLSTRQNGLLKYVPRFTEREAQLFSTGIFGSPPFRPTQWLSRLASDGVLQVLDQDNYWTRRGVLTVDWTGEEQPVWQVQPAYPPKDEL
ncbi:hypothetical protein [Pseudomonas sp. 18175]|uniref:hypothetical protein n=1 Tax=Pseudomonas sp. 18175 TaxID=3390056 RepID=UPI003D248170